MFVRWVPRVIFRFPYWNFTLTEIVTRARVNALRGLRQNSYVAGNSVFSQDANRLIFCAEIIERFAKVGA